MDMDRFTGVFACMASAFRFSLILPTTLSVESRFGFALFGWHGMVMRSKAFLFGWYTCLVYVCTKDTAAYHSWLPGNHVWCGGYGGRDEKGKGDCCRLGLGT